MLDRCRGIDRVHLAPDQPGDRAWSDAVRTTRCFENAPFCQNERYTSGSACALSASVLVSETIPTISIGRFTSPGKRICRPSVFEPGKYFRENAWFTTATRGASALSVDAKPAAVEHAHAHQVEIIGGDRAKRQVQLSADAVGPGLPDQFHRSGPLVAGQRQPPDERAFGRRRAKRPLARARRCEIASRFPA